MTLEPTGRSVFLIILAHAAVLGGGWWWMTKAQPPAASDDVRSPHGFSPRDMATPSARPMSQEMPAPQTSAQAPAAEALTTALLTASQPPVVVRQSKFEVTLSHKTPGPPPAGPALSGNGQAAGMSGVDQVIVDAFKQNWVLPAALDMEGRPREAQMDVVIARDGRILNYMLVKPSGHSQVDMSALRSAGLVKRIATPLPAQFSGDSYEVQLHFHAE